MNCDCCNLHQAWDVASMPYIPMSISYCIPCIKAGNYPLWALAANTAMIGGIEYAHENWRLMVLTSINYQGVSVEEFTLMVQKDMEELDAG